MADATGDRIRKLEIMKRLVDIGTVYTRSRPCLTPYLTMYWGDTHSPLRTAYRSILDLRIVYRHFWPRVLRTV